MHIPPNWAKLKPGDSLRSDRIWGQHHTRKPSGEKLTRIAQALEVTTDYLLDESEKPCDEALKEAFFRKFSKFDPNDQAKINQMIDMWGKKD